jgi:hypothetical protein
LFCDSREDRFYLIHCISFIAYYSEGRQHQTSRYSINFNVVNGVSSMMGKIESQNLVIVPGLIIATNLLLFI